MTELPYHLRFLLEVVDDPVLLVRPDGLVLGASAALARRLGLPRQAVAGRSLADLLTASRTETATYLRRVARSRQSAIGALTFRRTDGSLFHCRCAGKRAEAERPDMPAVLLLRCQERAEAASPFLVLNRRIDELAKEITRRRQVEEALQHLNRDLETRVQEEVAARAQVQMRLGQAQRLEALGQLAAGIAHDFNNVLQAVSGGLALIQARAGNPDAVRQFARMAISAAERGAGITRRLLAFARQGELRAELVPIAPLLIELREILAPTLGVSITVLIDADPTVPLLRVDKSQLETVLVNLAINARDAMPTGGTLTLTTMAETVRAAGTHAAGLPPGQYIRLSVSDTGVGMDAATLARAAEPFFTTKEVGRGTGLGLAMARGFAEQSGGGFAIESREGQGTTVTLWLPRTPETLAAPVRTPDGIAAAAAAPARVLLVDDDILVRQALAGQLRDEGYDVVEASDGLAALAWFDKGEKADLLVTDFAMPGMNGLALINEARGRWRSLPVLLLTGYADGSVQHAIDTALGATTVLLRKPVRGIELAERAAALLACATGGRS